MALSFGAVEILCRLHDDWPQSLRFARESAGERELDPSPSAARSSRIAPPCSSRGYMAS